MDNPQIKELTKQADQAIKLGHYHQAVKYYIKALKINKNNPDLLNMFAVALKLIKKNNFCLHFLNKAISLKPDSAVYLSNMGTILLSMQRIEEARKCYEKALKIKPDFKDTAINLCRIYSSEGNTKMILSIIEKQLIFYPDDKVLLLQKGLQLAVLQKFPLAFNILSPLYNENQNNEKFLFYLAVCCYNLNKFFEAAELFKKCLNINPNNYNYWNYYGVTQKRLKVRNYREEVKCFRKAMALSLTPNSPCHNLANTLISADKLDMATKLLTKIVNDQPNFAEALVSLGYVYQLCGITELAEKYYLESIKQNNALPGAHTNLGLLYLSLGNFSKGWEEYEWRWQNPDLQDIKENFTDNRWQGESLDNKTLMIFTEQGFGDTIQFVRYLPLINKETGKIIMECRDALVELMQTVDNVDQIVPRKKPFPAHDFYIPLVSLAKLFDTNINNIPHDVPYLSVDESKLKHWQDYFAQYGDALKIGITWAGNPRHKHDRYRTIKPELFKKLKLNDKIMLFSLQKEIADEDVRKHDFIPLGSQLNNFTDTAACLKALDLIISVDTALVHLAGALNLPVWVLLGFYCDWRWLKEREDSPWYPSMRLFRQPVRHDWDTPFSNIIQSVTELIEQKS